MGRIRGASSSLRPGLRPSWLAAALAAVAVCGGAYAQSINGKLESIGFEGQGSSLFLIREGQWFPILGSFSTPNTSPVQGSLSMECKDLDGDRVDFVETPVTITSGIDKRIWSYAASFGVSPPVNLELDVYDDRDTPIPQTAPLRREVELVGHDTLLILDMSSPQVTAFRNLDRGQGTYIAMEWGSRRFFRPVCVATLPSERMPDRWFGFEAAEVILWDEPDPDKHSNDQLAALIQWVRNGGQLVIGVGRAWQKLAASPLADILPITGDKPPTPTLQLKRFTEQFRNAVDAEERKAAVVLAPSTLVAGAKATFQESLPSGELCNLITMRLVGSGRVIATAASLKDLSAGFGVREELFQALLDLNVNSAEFRKAEQEWHANGLNLRDVADVHPPLMEPIEFRQTATGFVFGAVAFVLAYGILATAASWFWLRKHKLTHLAWTVFAGFAVVASALSLGAVWSVQGIRDKVSSVSLIDCESGSVQGRGHVFLGFKRAARQDVELTLPGDGTFLRPLSPGPQRSLEYATPERYRAEPGKARLEGVPIRATLKQFEGYWAGELEGPVRAQITVDRATGRVTPESWIQNDMSHELSGGWLLFIDPRLTDPIRPDGPPYRVVGMDFRKKDFKTDKITEKWLGSERIPPAANVLALRVPPLPPGQKISQIGQKSYEAFEKAHAQWRSLSAPEAPKEPTLETLWHWQVGDWAGGVARAFARSFGATDANWSALLMASTRNLYLHTRNEPNFATIGAPMKFDGVPNVDITHWLVRDTGVLLLQSEQPSPAMLHVNGDPVTNRDGRTLYRVRLPLTYTGTPPR